MSVLTAVDAAQAQYNVWALSKLVAVCATIPPTDLQRHDKGPGLRCDHTHQHTGLTASCIIRPPVLHGARDNESHGCCGGVVVFAI